MGKRSMNTIKATTLRWKHSQNTLGIACPPQVSNSELNGLEAKFMKLLDWKLLVKPAEYEHYHRSVRTARDPGEGARQLFARHPCRLGLHTTWGGGLGRHPDFPKTLGNRENP